MKHISIRTDTQRHTPLSFQRQNPDEGHEKVNSVRLILTRQMNSEKHVYRGVRGHRIIRLIS